MRAFLLKMGLMTVKQRAKELKCFVKLSWVMIFCEFITMNGSFHKRDELFDP